MALVIVLALGYVGGSVVGDDHRWTFAPWRMYSSLSTVPCTTLSPRPQAALIRTALRNPLSGSSELNPPAWNRTKAPSYQEFE